MAKSTDSQSVRDDESVTPAPGAKATPEEPKTGIKAIIAKVMGSRPVRVFQHFGAKGGNLLAAGMSYQAIFAVFAAIWVAFSVAGFIIDGNDDLKKALFDGLNQAAPGLIGKNGAIDPETLLSAGVLGWTGVVALAGLLLTALGFLASIRDAIRAMFDLPADKTFFLLLKAKDLGLAVGFGIVILISAVISLVSTAALDWIFGLLGLDQKSLFAVIVARAIGLVIVLAIDTASVAAAYRVLSGIPIPARRLWAGSLLAGVALGVLKTLGSALLGGATSNPLLASFAVIIGLLIWFNLICRVLLIGATWIAVGMADANIDPRALSPEAIELEEARKLEEARRLVADSNRQRAEDEIRNSHGLRRWRLVRRLKEEARSEARRREAVPTEAEVKEKADKGSTDPAADASKGIHSMSENRVSEGKK